MIEEVRPRSGGLELRREQQRAVVGVLDHVRRPGAVWSGAERLAAAAEIRRAADCELCQQRGASVSPAAVTGRHDAGDDLPPVAIDIVHRLATDPGRLTRTWYDRVTSDGVSDAGYVELVGVTALVVMIDTFADALGAPPPGLPAADGGEPTGRIAPRAGRTVAWVPTAPTDDLPLEVEEFFARHAEELPREPDGQARLGNVMMALTLVPSEQVAFHELSALPMYRGQRSLTPAQQESVAVAVSSANRCRYCTVSHAGRLYAAQSDVDVVGFVDRGAGRASGVDGSDVLRDFVDAVLDRTAARVDAARDELQSSLGPRAVVDAAGVLAHFDGINRISDGTGVELDARHEVAADLERLMDVWT